MYNESITLYQTYVFFLQKIVLMILLTNTIYNTTITLKKLSFFELYYK